MLGAIRIGAPHDFSGILAPAFIPWVVYLGGRFHNEGVARNECGGDFAPCEVERVVERRDCNNDPEGHTRDESELVALFSGK